MTLFSMSTFFKLFILYALMMVAVVHNDKILQSIENDSLPPNKHVWYPDPKLDKGILSVAQWPYKKSHPHHYGMESPTNIITARAVPMFLTPIKVHSLFTMPESAVIIENTGYYLEMKLQPDLKKKPYITGGPLFSDCYLFEQIHFHWGNYNYCGSEHRVNGKCYSTEVHIVWYNSKYDNFKTATKHADGVAVIAFFGEISKEDNPEFDELVECISKVIEPKTETTGSFHKEFAFLDVLFQQETYYSFPGSLTTKPYHKCVTWIMYTDEPFPISEAQLDAFRELKAEDGTHMIRENDRELHLFGIRPIIQPLLNKKLCIDSSESSE